MQIGLNFFRQKLIFKPENERREIEDNENFPPFVIAFNKYLKENNTIILQKDFFKYYCKLNFNNSVVNAIITNRETCRALETRILRAYPSYVRDVLLYENLKRRGLNVVFNEEQDLKGIDITYINKKGKEIYIHCYVQSASGEHYRQIKKEFRHNYEDRINLELKLNRSYCRNFGDFKFYRSSQIENLIKKAEAIGD